MRGATTATLGTLAATGVDGDRPAPYCSLVLSACDHDGSPILLLSTLARHTANLGTSDAVSLLFDGTQGLDDPLTGPRATILGAIAPTTDARHRARFLARHPSAAQYADFGDFSFYRVAVREAHLVAGFGRIFSLPGGDTVLPAAAVRAIAEAEGDIVGHMNADHGDAIDAYARGMAGRAETGWRMAACDSEGIDLRHGNTLIRINFPAIAATVQDVRTRLVEMAQVARETGK
jgi:putative heme iron utilization protein